MCLYPNCLAQRDLCIGRCDVCLAENSRKYLRPLIQCDLMSQSKTFDWLIRSTHPGRMGVLQIVKIRKHILRFFAPKK